MPSFILNVFILLTALCGASAEWYGPEAERGDLNRRGFSNVVSYSIDWQESIYIPPASGGVSYSSSIIPSVSAWSSILPSSWPSYSSSASSIPIAQSSAAGARPSRSQVANNNRPVNSQAASASAAPSPPSPGAAATFSSLGYNMTMLLAMLCGILAFFL